MQINCTAYNNYCTMNYIGFKNFRRFQNFEPMEFKGITFLVGKNNAGKSTVVKAILLVLNYLKSNDFEKFSFANNVLDEANIVTYGRALNSISKEINEDLISFSFKYKLIKIDLTISGHHDNTSANVQYLTITCPDKLSFSFNIIERKLTIKKDEARSVKEKNLGLEKLVTDQKSLRKQIKTYKEDKAGIEYIELLSLEKRITSNILSIRSSLKKIEKGSSSEFEIEGDFGNNKTLKEIVSKVVDEAFIKYKDNFESIQKGIKSNDKFANLRGLKIFNPENVKTYFNIFKFNVDDLLLFYVGSCAQKQSALFSIRDTKNILAQSIHDYFQLNISPGEEEHDFIIKWMKEFEVGDNFKLEIISGEAYQFIISIVNSETHLADMGMGSVQIMSIILRLACAIKKTKYTVYETGSYISDDKIIDYGPNFEVRKSNIVIMVEEPELNLHPALQSKLAYLFHEVYVNFNISFLIETHSEYLIRNTQLIVKESEYEVSPNVNPFCVIYFDQESKKWGMNYREDGKFIEEFGSGFFNETRNIIKQMM